MARQRLGQHFLGDLGWRKRILETLPCNPDETWLEIGAGHGEMTQYLAERARRVIAIETDLKLLPRLRERAASEWNNVEIIAGDVLSLDVGKLTESNFRNAFQGVGPLGPTKSTIKEGALAPEVEAAFKETFRVYGNLPYYITSPILHQLFTYAARIASIHIVIQLEVAERIVARPGGREFGYLSALCQFYAKPEIVFRIPPGAFRPPPRVTSALLKMAMPGERASLGVADEKRFLEFIQQCFGQKRKTLRNNLRASASEGKILQALSASGIRPDTRAEQLTLAQFAALFARLT